MVVFIIKLDRDVLASRRCGNSLNAFLGTNMRKCSRAAAAATYRFGRGLQTFQATNPRLTEGFRRVALSSNLWRYSPVRGFRRHLRLSERQQVYASTRTPGSRRAERFPATYLAPNHPPWHRASQRLHGTAAF